MCVQCGIYRVRAIWDNRVTISICEAHASQVEIHIYEYDVAAMWV
jgi:hypothetical protein